MAWITELSTISLSRGETGHFAYGGKCMPQMPGKGTSQFLSEQQVAQILEVTTEKPRQNIASLHLDDSLVSLPKADRRRVIRFKTMIAVRENFAPVTSLVTGGFASLDLLDCDDAWFDEARRLNEVGEPGKALDLVYEKMDAWLCEGDLETCNDFLGRAEVEKIPPRLILAILALTKPASGELDNREAFFERAWQTMQAHGKDVQKLLGRLRAPHGVIQKRSRNFDQFPRWS